MDLYCPVCGEPWDFDSLHDEAQARYAIPYYLVDATQDYWLRDMDRKKEKNPSWISEDYQKVFAKVSEEFRTEGCKALERAFGRQSSCRKPTDKELSKLDRDRTFGLTRQEAAGALYDILGDDMDGAAAMLEDLGF